MTTVYPTSTHGVHGNSGGKSAGKDVFPSGKGRKCLETSGDWYSGFLWEWGQPRFAVKNGDFDIDFLTHCFDDGYNNLFRKEPGTNVFKSEGNSFFRKEGLGEAKSFFDYFLSNLEEVKDKGYISVVTGNHDLPRISIGRTPEELKTVFAFILALPCIPLIYYGDEIGMPYSDLKNKDGGYCRTGSRTPMQWADAKNAGFSDTDEDLYLPIHPDYKTVNVDVQLQDAESIVREVQKMVSIKREHPELFACGNEFVLVSDTYPLVFKRTDGERTFLCAVNPSDREYVVNTTHKTVLTHAHAAVESDRVILGPQSYVWLEV